jgi:hypothetical protein
MRETTQLRVAGPRPLPATRGWRLRVGGEQGDFDTWRTVDAGDVSVELQLDGQSERVAFQVSIMLEAHCRVGTRTELALQLPGPLTDLGSIVIGRRVPHLSPSEMVAL